jgi:hypothetical protein
MRAIKYSMFSIQANRSEVGELSLVLRQFPLLRRNNASDFLVTPCHFAATRLIERGLHASLMLATKKDGHRK